MRTVVFAVVALASLTSAVSDMSRALAKGSNPRLSQPASTPNEDGWIFPGEYESHEAMWMLWPTYENKAGFPSTDVVSDLIAAMKNHTIVNLAVQGPQDEAAARELLTARGVAFDHYAAPATAQQRVAIAAVLAIPGAELAEPPVRDPQAPQDLGDDSPAAFGRTRPQLVRRERARDVIRQH